MPLQVQDPALLDLYASLLSPEEQQHVKAATSQAARKERLLARALQRSVLSRSAATSKALVVKSQEFQRGVETLQAAIMASCSAITLAKAASTGFPVLQ